MDPNVIVNRIVRLAKLDTTVFDEVRDDARELIPALIVAAIACLLSGLGATLWWNVVPDIGETPDGLVVNTLILGTIFTAAMYGVAALIIYVVMAQMYKVTVDLQALLRTMGYAAFPLALCILQFIPVIWPVFALVPLALLFVMMIYAVQSATAADSTQVVMATTIGFAAMVLVLGIISTSGGYQDAPIGAGIFGVLIDFR
jgi:hypothetical protein